MEREPCICILQKLRDGHWKITTAFPYNSEEYSIHNPTINESGTLLYFSSDMKGGFGGKDLYKSENKNGQWIKTCKPWRKY